MVSEPGKGTTNGCLSLVGSLVCDTLRLVGQE